VSRPEKTIMIRFITPIYRNAGLACLGFCLALLSVPVLAAQAAAPAGVAGHWEGVILVREGEAEVDFSVEIAPGPDGAWSGTITVPLQDIQDRPLEAVFLDDDLFSMVMRDNGSPSFFRGTLGAGGESVTGDLKEGEQANRFVMHRAARRPAAHPAEVIHLGEDLAALKQRFNSDPGPRLLMILSPSCSGCLMSARLVGRYALDKIADPRLRVHVVWVPIGPKDTYDLARKASIHLTDPRVTQYWMDTISLANAFKEPLGFKELPAWDVLLLYPAGQTWGAGVPKPASFMHRSKELPNESRLNGTKLAAELEKMLAEGKH
jgi:hypothetical protein